MSVEGGGPIGAGGGATAMREAPTPLVALIGPPNSGKTTLFNQLTGLRQKVGNYPGVTVEKHLGLVRAHGEIVAEVIDLPGINGFSARTLDERVTRDVLEGRVEGLRKPDALVLVVDSTRLEQQLMLLEPLLHLDLPTLLVLNMADELEERGGKLDPSALAEGFGLRATRANARVGEGLDQVRSFLDSVRSEMVPGRTRSTPELPHAGALPMVDAYAERRQRVRRIVQQSGYRQPGAPTLTERLDGVLLHKVWGPLVFFAVVLLVFQSIFTWAVPLMDGVEALVAISGGWIASALPDSWLRALLVDGVWAGVGAVIVFLPQILILFLFIGLLEDSGYMARAAVIADRLMLRVGLQGRAFLPLLSGYACAVPAVLAARTVENERDRLATIFVTPFMTCSARLPVYALLIAAFIPDEPLLGPVLGMRAATLLGLYALGAAAAVVTAFLIKRSLLKGESSPFMMELPPYRVPTLRSQLLRLYDRCGVFLKRVGKIILTVSIILWALTQFPTVGGTTPPIEDSALGVIGHVIEPVIEPLGYDWRVGIGLVASLAAREVIVATLGTIYGVEEASEGSLELQAALQGYLDLGAAIGLLIFFAFALQCVSTIAVVRRETGGWKWPALQFGYMLALAYTGAFLANWLI